MDIAPCGSMIPVAEPGGVGKAADRLDIAPPPVARRIRMLASEPGTRLSDRQGRGAVITATGRTILGHALRITAAIESIRDPTADGRSAFRGTVAIGRAVEADPSRGQSASCAWASARRCRRSRRSTGQAG